MKSFFFILAPSCTLGSKLRLLRYCPLHCPNKGRRGCELSSQAGCRAVGSCYGREGATDPSCAPTGILQSLSVCNNTSHDAPSFTIYLRPPHFQRKAVRTRTTALSLLFIERCLKLRRKLGYVTPDKERREGKEKKKKTIKINTAVLHSFTGKQQLHKTGKKYYLCDRKTIRHR